MRTTNNKRTLKQMILLSVSILLLLLLSGSFILNISLSKDYVQERLAQHSQEAATFLGLSLSTIAENEDLVAEARMIDALFDSGDYQLIRYQNTRGKVFLEKQLMSLRSDVPAWFVGLLNLNAVSGDAKVMTGWRQKGVLFVQSNASDAYQKLWQIFKSQVVWLVFVSVFGLLGLYVLMRKLLKPLADMEVQARELAHNHFEGRMSIPASRELAEVAQSINEMSASLERVFHEQLSVIERMRDQSRKDPLTQLFNREGFDARLKADLTSNSVLGQGVLVLIMLRDFDDVNSSQGRQAGDSLLLDVARIANEAIEGIHGAYAARRSGAQFSLFLPAVSFDAVEQISAQILSRVLALPFLRQSLQDDWLSIGLAVVDQGETLKDLLSKADLALRQAQSKQVSTWQRYVESELDGAIADVHQANHWKQILQGVLAENTLILHEQSVFELVSRKKVHSQILSRIDVDGKLVVAATFLPMAKRFGLMVLFDQMVVEKVLESMDAQLGQRYHVTLSEAAIADEHFMVWLSERLMSHRDLLPMLTLEVPEHALSFGESILGRLCELGRQWGFAVCVDRFGVSSVPFSYIQRIGISAIKIDSSFVRDIHINQDNQFFLRATVQIAHSQKIKVIAIGVESEQELSMLRELGVDAAMGFALEHPSEAKF
jgi:diguanylate cyclase (GGDEF)-like protein